MTEFEIGGQQLALGILLSQVEHDSGELGQDQVAVHKRPQLAGGIRRRNSGV